MTVLHSQLNPRSADFQHNAAAMRALVDDLRAHLERVAQGGGEAPRAKHTARGKLLPRDRVQMLLDSGTPFLEVAPLAALNMYNNDAPSSGVIVGIGRVSGVDCMIVCNDATVKGGTYYPLTVKKRRPSPPDKCRAGGFAARSLAHANAFSPSSGSRCRPSPWRTRTTPPARA